MAQFDCEICGEGFEQKSAYERHMTTSHPERAPSAADVEKAVKGIEFPETRDGLIDAARGSADPELLAILRQLPDREFRDSAEVARALGEVRSREAKQQHQPSRKGGARAMESLSAARLASLFADVSFPASASELKERIRPAADDEEMAVIEELQGGTYKDMSDVAEEIGRIKRAGGSGA